MFWFCFSYLFWYLPCWHNCKMFSYATDTGDAQSKCTEPFMMKSAAQPYPFRATVKMRSLVTTAHLRLDSGCLSNEFLLFMNTLRFSGLKILLISTTHELKSPARSWFCLPDTGQRPQPRSNHMDFMILCTVTIKLLWHSRWLKMAVRSS